MRGSFVANNLYNSEKKSYKETLKDMIKLKNYMISRGINAAPLVSEFCEKNLDLCM